jgi:hypothetical protein
MPAESASEPFAFPADREAEFSLGRLDVRHEHQQPRKTIAIRVARIATNLTRHKISDPSEGTRGCRLNVEVIKS